MPLVVVGLNHTTASIDIREKMSVAQDSISLAVQQLCQHESIDACVITSTCNRTEFYFDCDSCEIAQTQYCQWFGYTFDQIGQHLYTHTNLDCIKHLFAVASGLDSLVLGEAQILGQVKSAYDISKQSGFLNKTTDRFFQTAFRIAKSVRSNTNIGKNPVSIANSSVQLSKQIFGELNNQNILVIGAGSTSELLLRYLSKHSYHSLAICNRTLSNANKLAKQFNCTGFELSQLPNRISAYDLIFSATASKKPIIDCEIIKSALSQRKHRPIVIIDLAIPRDVDVCVKKFNDVFYYAVDDLQKVISSNLKNREQAALVAREIIQTEAESFCYWLKSQQHTQLISKFQQETAKIRNHSLNKALKLLNKGEDVEEVLFQLANNLTKKLNHTPVKAIRDAINSGDENTINTITTLLKLD